MSDAAADRRAPEVIHVDRFVTPSSLAVLALAGALLAPGAASAQVGVKAGLSSATISFDPAPGSRPLSETRRRTGGVGGVFVLLPGTRIGGWQIEALVIQKGARNLLRVDDAMRLTYLEVPALIRVDAARRRRGAIFLLAGPSFAFNLKGSYEDDGAKEDIRKDINKGDVGLHLGGGAEYGPLAVDARYVWGLRTVFEDGDLAGTFKNRAFVVTAGLAFGR
jgi:hypothetical protein